MNKACLIKRIKNRIENPSKRKVSSLNETDNYVQRFSSLPYLQSHVPCELSFKERCKIVLKGCALGDYAGQPYEAASWLECKYLKMKDLYQKSKDCTDDTILTCATAEVLLSDLNTGRCFDKVYREYAMAYPSPLGGYGPKFLEWVYTGAAPNSCGNGSAMRVGPCGCLDSIEDVIKSAYESAVCTHRHPEGIKGAIVTAVCIWMAFHGYSKKDIGNYCAFYYQGYPYSPANSFEKMLSYKEVQGNPAICQTTVPMAVSCFVSSDSYEDCILKAIQFGWDTDTQAAIAGSIAAAYYRNFSDESNKAYQQFTTQGDYGAKLPSLGE